jgi:hypothetical protein
MRGLLAEVGFAGAVLARELPDGSLQLIDGHLRAETVAGSDIPVLILDVTEEEADKILATYDPIGAMAGRDQMMLDELLRGIESESTALQSMLDSMSTSIPEVDPPEDFPAFDESIETEHECPKCGYKWSGGNASSTSET